MPSILELQEIDVSFKESPPEDLLLSENCPENINILHSKGDQ